jgi:tRNA A-37 threonylcarbamoyl transferase component Bud32
MTVSPGADQPLHLRLRRPTPALLGLPWASRLADWSDETVAFRRLPVGPSRHLVRFVIVGNDTVALKEEPVGVARSEYEALREMEALGLPSVRVIGIAERPGEDVAIIATDFLRHSLQYRRLLARMPLVAGGYRDRLLDAMASLLVDLHRAGVFWGDCSLANTLLRRDGDRLQAFLVDAETSEIHPRLSDGQRAADLEVLVENVAFGLADLAAMQGTGATPDGIGASMDEQLAAAEAVRERYLGLWDELFRVETVAAGDAFAVEARIRRLNDLGFAVEEIELEPGDGPSSGQGQARLRVIVSERDFHTRELRRRARINALEGQARLLLNDLREYRAWLASSSGRPVSLEEGTARWHAERLDPALARLALIIGPGRDALQAYCDLLEHKWLLSERAGRDVGLEAAFASYVDSGAPAPETAEPVADPEAEPS